MLKKPNFIIVWNYLAAKPGERTLCLYPEHDLEFGVYDERLHHILHKADEDLWCLSDMPMNEFVKVCEQMSDEQIIGLVFTEGMRKEMRNMFPERSLLVNVLERQKTCE